MFREMRRKRQQLSAEKTEAIFEQGTHGVLSLIGDDGYPYGVPISYVYADNKIYIHSALEGHKIDAIRACDKVSFTVVDADDIVADEYTTYFRSAIAFGRARILEDREEKMKALRLLGDHYNPGQEQALEAEISKGFERLHIIEISIENMSGKQAIELARS